MSAFDIREKGSNYDFHLLINDWSIKKTVVLTYEMTLIFSLFLHVLMIKIYKANLMFIFIIMIVLIKLIKF